MLRIENVSYTYDELPVLADINLRIQRREHVAIIGESGCYLKENGITCIVATHDYNDVLPFTDRVIVLRNKTILAKGKPMELYKNPKDLYVASLFGEATSVSIDVLKSYGNTKRKIIVYAHEFKVSEVSGIPTTVKTSYPMGNYYLVEGKMENNDLVFFHADEAYPTEKQVFLNVSLATINQRIQQPSI